jgi:2-aminoadipate transaminase
MRLSYCHPPPERIREGVRRLVAVIDQELELRETFGAAAGRIGADDYGSPTPDMS